VGEGDTTAVSLHQEDLPQRESTEASADFVVHKSARHIATAQSQSRRAKCEVSILPVSEVRRVEPTRKRQCAAPKEHGRSREQQDVLGLNEPSRRGLSSTTTPVETVWVQAMSAVVEPLGVLCKKEPGRGDVDTRLHKRPNTPGLNLGVRIEEEEILATRGGDTGVGSTGKARVPL